MSKDDHMFDLHESTGQQQSLNQRHFNQLYYFLPFPITCTIKFLSKTGFDGPYSTAGIGPYVKGFTWVISTSFSTSGKTFGDLKRLQIYMAI